MLLVITRRLIIMTGIALLFVVCVFGMTFFFGERFMVSWACFGCGLVGGFVSIQQRLKKVGNEELELLSRSWFQILLIPVYGGVFALVLYIGFLGGVVEGPLFPSFSIPAFTEPLPTRDDIQKFFASTYPSSGSDVAKLLFWSFVAGFSERFVPQILDRTQQGRSNQNVKGNGHATKPKISDSRAHSTASTGNAG
jgi:hypothetical protein